MKKRNWNAYVLLLCCMVLLAGPVAANAGENHARSLAAGQFEAAGFLSASEIEYEVDGGGEGDIERKILGLSLSRGISDQLGVFGTFGYLFDGESGSASLDSGYHLSGGARYKVLESGQLSCHLYGQLNYILDETYTFRRNESTLSGWEIVLGGVAKYAINDQLSAYGGLSLAPFQSLEDKFSGPNVRSTTTDLDRSNMLGVKLGVDYDINEKWAVSGDLDIGSEKAFTVNFGAKF